jgi:hypothetical protein
MQASFSIDVDPARHFVRIRMSGFYKTDDIARFIAARELTLGQLTCGPNEHLTLVDIREMVIQSQEAVAGFGKVIHDPRHMSKRLAIVVSRSLARMQIQRAAAGRDVHYFTDDAGAAEQWLIDGDASTNSPPRRAGVTHLRPSPG